ncbi:UNVERIFIED_CONTAM: hypothetical protein NCL1_44501 [Trichonephila clavipes]
MFDPEKPSTTKGMPNLKRKLKSNETNVELRWRKKWISPSSWRRFILEHTRRFINPEDGIGGVDLLDRLL